MSISRFERIIIGLPHGAGPGLAVQALAEFAEELHVDLLGTFIADENFQALIGLPGRELRMLDLQWQPVDFQRIYRDIEEAAAIARRRFAERVGSCTVKTSFDIVAGANRIGSLIRAGDIVAVIEPAHPGERITQQFVALLDAAFATAAAVLVVPGRILRGQGPVVALAEGEDDASIRAALEMAAALKERLVIALAPGARAAPELLAQARQLGVDVEQIALGRTGPDQPALAFSPYRLKERLRVVSGRLQPDLRALFSTLHGIPLLIVEPHGARWVGQQDEGKAAPE